MESLVIPGKPGKKSADPGAFINIRFTHTAVGKTKLRFQGVRIFGKAELKMSDLISTTLNPWFAPLSLAAIFKIIMLCG